MKRLAIAAIAVLGAIHWITTAAVADGKQVLQYVETIPSGEVGGWTVGRHRVTQVPPGGHYFVQHDWADPPREIGPEGFRLELAMVLSGGR